MMGILDAVAAVAASSLASPEPRFEIVSFPELELDLPAVVYCLVKRALDLVYFLCRDVREVVLLSLAQTELVVTADKKHLLSLGSFRGVSIVGLEDFVTSVSAD
jgi:hypothetical protein